MLVGEGVETINLHIQVNGGSLFFNVGIEGITRYMLHEVQEMKFQLCYWNEVGEEDEITLGILPVMVDGFDVFGIFDADTENSLEPQTLKYLLEQFNEIHTHKKWLN